MNCSDVNMTWSCLNANQSYSSVLLSGSTIRKRECSASFFVVLSPLPARFSDSSCFFCSPASDAEARDSDEFD